MLRVPAVAGLIRVYIGPRVLNLVPNCDKGRVRRLSQLFGSILGVHDRDCGDLSTDLGKMALDPEVE